ncbi:hypothetical protein A2567_00765 [Candidatus Azambacteria bacterium RIFOXYD1_FULL_42_11]|uniref:Uncharacterized protein n=4 Tax=Candidatus Azamiibacteriota TaxID=1752741 RepID=A0A0G0ZD18_9BACT|nr:MAG: hypothetical protein UV07_C0009G0057 [Candidatus Azambacteria bacterium GW2011_GWB1_42_17]KKS46600.1 MAG: hypothetical protein UV10_C0001G0057 [Candidatus Azambacteria bacterium GW2011_GWA1_42_19]KKS75795.1 MAG: hypothetical protein UV48_C0006G0009 [Candidatus Azambacteria bacterium GW2011_GWA2_42_9]KKS88906.1 MAG: hypothetical protein UV62_C0001G0048 [Parcubacteria group bacterium GW2011_GWC1_43_11]OGD41756.1 MAG: hypothetical protein A2567_00765 [Candidatus Azambacteria bacterium RIFO
MPLHPGLNISDVDKAKIIAAIENLKKKQADLRCDLKSMEEFNLAAWAEYGSELCPNEMAADERRISDEIKEFQKIIDLLGEFLAGHIKLSEEADLRISDNLCVVEIRMYEDRRAEIKARLEKISLIKSFLQ